MTGSRPTAPVRRSSGPARAGLGEALLDLATPAIAAMPSQTALTSPNPALVYLSTTSDAPPDTLWGAIAPAFSQLQCVRETDAIPPPATGPLTPCVALLDFRADPLREFGESDVVLLGRIQAQLPHAILVLLTPPLNIRMKRLIHQAGVRRVYSGAVDWGALAGILQDLAHRIARPSGQAKRREIALMEICLAMGSTLELKPLLDKILAMMMADLDVQQGSILLFDRESDQLRMLASRGLPDDIAGKGYIPRKGSIAEWVIDNDQPLILHEAVHDDRFAPIGDRRPIISSLCVPLRARGEVHGTINLNRLAPAQRFTEEDLDTAVILAAHAASSIESARLYESNLQAERLATVGQTVAGISHSMKSIITSLRGGISICETAHARRNWDLMEKGWGLVRRNFERMSGMALEMLEYSKTERVPVRTRFVAEGFFREILNTAASRAQAKDVTLSCVVAPEVGALNGDQDQLFRAFLNIVENGVDAVPPGGKVETRVQAFEEDGHHDGDGPPLRFVRIIVSDNGPGIAPEDRERIFTPFFSAKGSKGTGLGLPVAQKVILEHGGSIHLTSEPGQGAQFTILLPV